MKYKLWNSTLRWLSTLILYVTRPLIKKISWPVILVVNAGAGVETSSYGNKWMLKHLDKKNLYGIGFYRMPTNSLALVIGVSYSNEQVRSTSAPIKKIIEEVSTWKANKIALLGLLPSAAHKFNLWPSEDLRFVKGQYGTVTMIRFNIDSLIKAHPYLKGRPVGIVGAGFTGVAAANGIQDKYDVRAFDQNTELKPKFVGKRIKYFSNDYEKLESCGVVVLLTLTGDGGIDTVRDYIHAKHIILADTHPRPTDRGWSLVEEKNAIGYVCGTKLKNGLFIPALAGWDKRNVVGCALEAIVTENEVTICDSIEEFRSLARKKGVQSNMEFIEQIESSSLNEITLAAE